VGWPSDRYISQTGTITVLLSMADNARFMQTIARLDAAKEEARNAERFTGQIDKYTDLSVCREPTVRDSSPSPLYHKNENLLCVNT
jgi:hypothetical protein